MNKNGIHINQNINKQVSRVAKLLYLLLLLRCSTTVIGSSTSNWVEDTVQAVIVHRTQKCLYADDHELIDIVTIFNRNLLGDGKILLNKKNYCTWSALDKHEMG